MIWVLIHIAAIQNYYTGTYIAMVCLQSLVNNLRMLVRQSSKSCPSNSESISPAIDIIIDNIRYYIQSLEHQ